MLREHFAPTGLGRRGRAMTIDISLLTELSCAVVKQDGLNSMAVCPSRSAFGIRKTFQTPEKVHGLVLFTGAPLPMFFGEKLF